MLLFSALVAGSFSLGARMAREIDPGVLVLLRFGLAALLMVAILRASTGRWPTVPRAPWRFVVLGGFFGFYFIMMFEGLKTADAVSSAAVFTLTPLMSAVFALPLLGQRTVLAVWGALLLGACGALWVIFRGDMPALLAFDIGTGEAIFFVGCIAHAIYTPLSRRLNRGESAGEAALWVMVGGILLLLIYAGPRLAGVDWAALSPLVWITLAYLVVFTTAGTTTLLQYAALRLPASNVMAYTYLVPSWVVLWDMATGFTAPPGIILLGVGATVLALLVLLLRHDVAAI